MTAVTTGGFRWAGTEGLCELGGSRVGPSVCSSWTGDGTPGPQTRGSARLLPRFVLILRTEFSEAFATPSPGFELIIVDFCSPAQCISLFSHHLIRSRFCISGALQRIFLYFNPKDFSFPIVLVGMEVGKPHGNYPYLIKLNFFPEIMGLLWISNPSFE